MGILKSGVSTHVLPPNISKMAEPLTHRISVRSHEPGCSQGAEFRGHPTAGQNTFSTGHFLK